MPAAPPTAAEIADWFKFRQTKFAELKAAAPHQTDEIAAIKARAAAAAAAAGPLGAIDRPPVIWPMGEAAPVVYDDPAAPRMVVIPAGEFTMGSPDTEPGHVAAEAPRRRVRIAHPFAVSMFPIVYGEYALFVADTHRASSPCVTIEGGVSAPRADRDWRNPGFPQTIRHPVTCVSFEDASAYAAWLSRKTGHAYRLLSEAEYEYADRAGSASAAWWGDAVEDACKHANGLDQDGKAANPDATPLACHDGYAFTAPEGSFKPNAFGLADTNGNVASWTADCWNPDHSGATSDGSARLTGDCRLRVIRGGSWASPSLRAARRGKDPVGYAAARQGFRVAREL